MDSAAANFDAQGHRVLAAIRIRRGKQHQTGRHFTIATITCDSPERHAYRRPCRHRGLPAPIGGARPDGWERSGARREGGLSAKRIMQGRGLMTVLNTAAQLAVALPGNIVTLCRRFPPRSNSYDIASRTRCDR